MTVAQITPSRSYTENGVTLSFAAPFRYLAADQLDVRRVLAGVETVLAYGISWTATPGPTDAGGTVTLTATVAGATLKIQRVTPREQQTDYVTGDSFPAETHELAQDRTIMIAQEQDQAASDLGARALRVPVGETVAVLPAAAVRANKFAGYDNVGNPTELADVGGAVAFAGSLAASGGAALVGTALFSQISAVTFGAGVTALWTSGRTAQGVGGGFYVADAMANAALAAAHPRFCVADLGGRYFRLAGNEIFVDQGGAVGDGVTDDAAAINATSSYAVAVGTPVVSMKKGKTYRHDTIINTRSNLTWNFAPTACNKQIVAFAPVFPATTIGYVASDVVGPTNQLPLTSVAGVAVGNDVLIRLGYNPWDNAEPLWGTTAKVLAIAGLVITVDVVIPAVTMGAYNYVTQGGTNIAVPAVPAGTAFRGVMLAPEGSNLVINDYDFLGDLPVGQSSEGAAYWQVGHNIIFNRPAANKDGDGDCGVGLVVGQFLRDVKVLSPVIGCNKNGRGQASMGRGFNFSNCINVLVDEPTTRKLENNFIFVESNCENVVVRNPKIEIPSTARASAGVFFACQNADLRVENPTITNLRDNQVNMLDSGGTDQNYTQNGVVKWRGAMPLSFGPLKDCLLDYRDTGAAKFTGQIVANVLTATGATGNAITIGALIRGGAANVKIVSFGTGTGGNGTYNVTATANIGPIAMRTEEFALVEFRNAKTSAARVDLVASMYDSHNLGGPYFDVSLFASSTAVLANTTIYLGYDNVNGADVSTSFTAGQERRYIGRDEFGQNYGGLNKLVGFGFVLTSHTATAPAGGSWVGVKTKSARVVRTSFTGGAATDLTGFTLPDSYAEEALNGVKQIPPAITLIDATTVTPNFGQGRNFEWTIGGNRTLANPIGAYTGQSGIIKIAQDATGNRIITWGNNFRFPGGAAVSGVLSVAANAVDTLRYTVGSDGKIYCEALNKAMAA